MAAPHPGEVRSVFRWEHSQRSWNTIEVVNGKLVSSNSETGLFDAEAQKRRQSLQGYQRGLIRALVIVIDLSRNGIEPREFTIPRVRLVSDQVTNFLKAYLDQNPLSQVAIVSTRGYYGHVESPLSGDLEAHLEAVRGLRDVSMWGQPSLVNSLTVSLSVLGSAPVFSTREILLVYGSMTTCDPEPLDTVCEKLTQPGKGAVVSAIGFSAKAFPLQRIVDATGGIYRVPTSPAHLEDLFQMHVVPPLWSDRTQIRSFIPFGFAKPVKEALAFDVRNLKNDGDGGPVIASLECPRCGTKVLEVPAYCPICSMLVMAPAHLTRSLQHLKPLASFEEVEKPGQNCMACNTRLPAKHMMCGKCRGSFCSECDKFVHECLQNCPGCLQL